VARVIGAGHPLISGVREQKTIMTIWIRGLGPGEFDELDVVFAGLSPASRYHRFNGANPPLLPAVRDAPAAVDGSRHIAVAAYADDEPVGIARLIATRDHPCDIAVEVIDRWQGHGIGTHLVLAVVERARTLGHTVVEADILAENRAVRQLIDHVFPAATSTMDRAEITSRGDLSPWRRDQSDAA
jgi:GNAT superfamily N-acetyltransferase